MAEERWRNTTLTSEPGLPKVEAMLAAKLSLQTLMALVRRRCRSAYHGSDLTSDLALASSCIRCCHRCHRCSRGRRASSSRLPAPALPTWTVKMTRCSNVAPGTVGGKAGGAGKSGGEGRAGPGDRGGGEGGGGEGGGKGGGGGIGVGDGDGGDRGGAMEEGVMAVGPE